MNRFRYLIIKIKDKIRLKKRMRTSRKMRRNLDIINCKRKLKKKLNKIKEKIIDIFSMHCPDCGARMKSEFLDMRYDSLVWKCTKCGKEWI